MKTTWSKVKAKLGHRLAMHVRVGGFRMRNETPMVSFTFDDVPKSAALTGAAILEDHGARGTFYVSGGLVGTDQPFWPTANAEDIVSLNEKGHEIGCHTFSHKRAYDLDRISMAREIEHNGQYLRSLMPSVELKSFAYPYGYGSFPRKLQLRSIFQSSRSIVPGINSGVADAQFLHAFPLIDLHINEAGVNRAFDGARNTNGWLIFYGHDVANEPSPYGCSPALLKHALRAASRWRIPVLTMAEALQCARA